MSPVTNRVCGRRSGASAGIVGRNRFGRQGHDLHRDAGPLRTRSSPCRSSDLQGPGLQANRAWQGHINGRLRPVTSTPSRWCWNRRPCIPSARGGCRRPPLSSLWRFRAGFPPVRLPRRSDQRRAPALRTAGRRPAGRPAAADDGLRARLPADDAVITVPIAAIESPRHRLGGARRTGHWRDLGHVSTRPRLWTQLLMNASRSAFRRSASVVAKPCEAPS